MNIRDLEFETEMEEEIQDQDDEMMEETDEVDEVSELRDEVEKLKKEMLYKQAEIQNIQRRYAKERNEILLTAGKNIFKDFLPIIDDLERAQDNIQKSSDVDALKSGVELIMSKFQKFLSDHGVEKIPTLGEDLNTDVHNAIAVVPGESGKIVDCVQNGYTLNGTILRVASVVVGQE